MAEQDFYLSFGSNVEAFVADVRREIGGAATELENLRSAIQEVNTATQGSPTSRLVSGIRDDIKAEMKGVAQAVGQELRSALQGELKNINIDVSASLDAGDTGTGSSRKSRRPSSTDVTDADKAAAKAAREIESTTLKVGKDFQSALVQAVGVLSDEVFAQIKKDAAKLGVNERAAFTALTGVLERLQAKAKSLASDIELREGLAEDTQRFASGQKGRAEKSVGGDATGLANLGDSMAGEVESLKNALVQVERDVKRLSGSSQKLIEGKATAQSIFNKTIHALRSVDEEAADRLERAVFDKPEGQQRPSRRVEEGAPSQDSGVLSDRLIAAGNIMTSAANEMKVAAEQFKAHIEAFRTAAQNLRVEGVVSTTTRPKTTKTTKTKTPKASPEPEPDYPTTISGPDALASKKKEADAAARSADTAAKNADTVGKLEDVDSKNLESAREELEARQRIINRLKSRVRDAKDLKVSKTDRETLQAAGISPRPAPPFQPSASVETQQGAIFTGKGAGETQRKLLRILELISARQSGRGASGVAEPLPFEERTARPGQFRSTEAFARAETGVPLEEELRILRAQLQPWEEETLRFLLEGQETAAQLRQAVIRLRSQIPEAGGEVVQGTLPAGSIDIGGDVSGGAGRPEILDREEGRGGLDAAVAAVEQEIDDLRLALAQLNQDIDVVRGAERGAEGRALTPGGEEVGSLAGAPERPLPVVREVDEEGVARERVLTEQELVDRIGAVTQRLQEAEQRLVKVGLERSRGTDSDRAPDAEVNDVLEAYERASAVEQERAEVIRKVTREAFQAKLTLEEFESVIKNLSRPQQADALRELENIDLEATDEAREAIKTRPTSRYDPNDPEAIEREELRLAAAERERVRTARALQEQRLAVARDEATRFRQTQTGKAPDSLFQVGRERGLDIDTQIATAEARLQAFSEQRQQAISEGSPDEARRLEDAIQRLTERLTNLRTRRDADADVTGAFFTGERFDGGRITPKRRDDLVEQAGPGLQQALGGIINIFERESAELDSLLSQYGNRLASLALLEQQQEFAGKTTAEGEPLGFTEKQIRKAERTVAQTEGIEEQIRPLERLLTTPGVAQEQATQALPEFADEIAKIFQGRSFQELVKGAAPRETDPTALEDARGEAVTNAFRASLREQGLQQGEKLPDFQERLGVEEYNAALRKAREASDRAGEAFDKEAREAEQIAQRQAELEPVYREIRAALQRFRDGLDVGALESRLRQEGLLQTSGIDQEALRAVAAGSTDPELLQRAAEPFGGLEGAADELLELRGIRPGREISQDEFVDEAGNVQTLDEMVSRVDAINRELETLRARLAEDSTAIALNKEIRDQGLDEKPFSTLPGRQRSELGSQIGKLETEQRQIESRLDARTRAVETSERQSGQFETEREALLTSNETLVAALRELAQRLTSGGALRNEQGLLTQSGAERISSLFNIGREAGIDPKLLTGENIETGENLLRLAEALAGNTEAQKSAEVATENNTDALRGDTDGGRPPSEIETEARQRLGRLSPDVAADLVEGLSGQVPLRGLASDELKAETGLSLGGRKSKETIEDVFAQARDLQGQELDRGGAQIRNILTKIAELVPPPGGVRTGDKITTDLITAASAARTALVGAAGTAGVGETIDQRARADLDGRLITVLGNLQSAISNLTACCDAMQAVVRQGGGGGTALSRDQEIARRRGTQGAEQILGAQTRSEITIALREAVAAATPEARRAALGRAALSAKGDPSLGLDDSTVVGVIQRFFSGLSAKNATRPPGFEGDLQDIPAADISQGAALSNEDIAAIQGGLLKLRTVLQKGGAEAAEAFKAGDIQAAAEALVTKTRDVDETLTTLRNSFDVTEEDIKELRPGLEALEQSLKDAAAAEKRAKAQAQADTPEAINKEQLRLASADRFVGPGRTVDLSDQSDAAALDTARAALENLGNEAIDQSRFLQELQGYYTQMNSDTQKEIRLLADKHNQTVLANQSAQAFADTLAQLLPPDLAERFRSAVGSGDQEIGSEVVGALEKQGRNVGVGVKAAVTQSLKPDPGVIKSQAIETVRTWGQAAQSELGRYRTPMQNLMHQIFQGRGIVQSTLATAGNYVSRFLGGSIVFGAVNQLQELGSQALEAEQTFIRVSAALEATGRSSDGLRTRLQDLSVETNVAIADTTEVLAQMVGVFETVDEAFEATRVVSQLELISQGALNAREGFKSISAVTSTFQSDLMAPLEEGGLGLTETGAVTYIADLAVRLQDLTGVNIEDTVEGLGRLGSTARALNIDMELLATSIGLTAKATGLNGTEISEQIGRILAQFQSADAQSLLVNLGITDEATIRAGDFGAVLESLFGKYEQLSEGQRRSIANILGGTRQFATTNALLIRGEEALETYEDALNNAGAAANRTEEILGTLRGQIGQFNKQIQALVTSLIELGVLNVFGVLLKGVSLLLKPINQVLQFLVDLSESSPFAGMLINLGLTIAGFATLITMVRGAVAQYQALALAQAQSAAAGTADATSGFMAGFARWRTARKERLANKVSLLDQARDLHRQRSFGSRFSTSRVGRALPGITGGRIGVGIDKAVRGASGALTGLRSALVKIGPAGLLAAGAIAALVSALKQESDEARKVFADRFADPDVDPRKEGESEADAARREELEKADQHAKDLANTGRFGVLDSDQKLIDDFVDSLQNLIEIFHFATKGIKEYITTIGTLGTGGLLAPIFDALGWDSLGDSLAGVVSTEGQGNIDSLIEDATSRAGGTLEEQMAAARAVEERFNEEARNIVEGEATTQQQAEAAKQLERVENIIDARIANLDAQINGLEGVVEYTPDQLAAAIEAFNFTSDFTPGQFANFQQDIEALFGTRLADESKSLLNQFGNATDQATRNAAQSQFLDAVVREARRDLRIAIDEKSDQDAIDSARERMEEVLKLRAEFDNELLKSLIDLPEGYADLAARVGDYARAEALISQALANVRSQIPGTAAGSAERQALETQQLDLLRKQAENSIAESVNALSLASALSRDSLGDTGRDLEAAQLKLQSAVNNPGAYSPDEVIDILQEIANLQDSIAEEQERIAQAYDDYRASAANNDVARTAIEYASALRRYRRAVEREEGAAAITEAATEVNEAARAQRAATNALEEARAETELARIPVGDDYARAGHELATAYRAQLTAIEEFGRNSVEFEEATRQVIEFQRNAEEVVRGMADAALGLAISLANAAGLDVRSAELSLQQAEADLRRALADSGGNQNTEAVQRAAAAFTDAQANVRDVILGEATSTIDFMLTMEEITERQAIQVLQQILDTADLTEDQRRDLLTRIKSLTDSINQGVNDQFNLGDIRIPTPFEVRRALKVEEITQGLQDAVDGVVDVESPLPSDNIGAAPEGLLEDVLGPDLANDILGLRADGGPITAEIRRVGQGLTGDLLPPISSIPKIIDEQLISRAAMVTESERRIQTMIANNEILNSSVTQLGVAIKPPLEQIREEQSLAKELLIDSNEELANANVYLEGIASNVGGLLSAVNAMAPSRGGGGTLTGGSEGGANTAPRVSGYSVSDIEANRARARAAVAEHEAQVDAYLAHTRAVDDYLQREARARPSMTNVNIGAERYEPGPAREPIIINDNRTANITTGTNPEDTRRIVREEMGPVAIGRESTGTTSRKSFG